MLTRLCQGQLDGAVEMLDRLLPLAPTPQENRFLSMLRGSLGGAPIRANRSRQSVSRKSSDCST